MQPDQQPEPSASIARRRGRAWLRRLVLLPLIVYGAWCALLYFKQTDLIFPRHLAGPTMSERSIPPEVERIWLQIKTPYEGRPPRVEAWFIPARDAAGNNTTATAPLAVYFHGNGELIDHCLDAVELYRNLGYHVLIPEYRGYGRSAGEPSQDAIVDDASRFIEQLLARPGVSPTGLVYHGRSLGSGVAAQVALRHPPSFLVLESPFTSIARFASGYGVPGVLVRSPFRTDRALPMISTRPPTLIMHSRDDEIVPFQHALDLAAVAPWATFHEMTGSHMAAIRSNPGAWDAIERLLNQRD